WPPAGLRQVYERRDRRLGLRTKFPLADPARTRTYRQSFSMSQAAEISVNNGETWSRYRVSKVIKGSTNRRFRGRLSYLLAKPGLLSLFSFALLEKISGKLSLEEGPS